jgi:hypothetical protein
VTVNKKLLLATLEFIEKHPRKHKQESWCGTRQCFAGWAVHLDGWRPTDDASAVRDFDILGDQDGDCPIVQQGSTMGPVKEVARQILGLDHEQADDLFGAFNSRKCLRELVEELCK